MEGIKWSSCTTLLCCKIGWGAATPQSENYHATSVNASQNNALASTTTSFHSSPSSNSLPTVGTTSRRASTTDIGSCTCQQRPCCCPSAPSGDVDAPTDLLDRTLKKRPSVLSSPAIMTSLTRRSRPASRKLLVRPFDEQVAHSETATNASQSEVREESESGNRDGEQRRQRRTSFLHSRLFRQRLDSNDETDIRSVENSGELENDFPADLSRRRSNSISETRSTRHRRTSLAFFRSRKSNLRARSNSVGNVSSDVNTNSINASGNDPSVDNPIRSYRLTMTYFHNSGVPGFKCPICSKLVLPDDLECHLVICLTKPRITYNEDVLTEDKGECVICLEDMTQGDTISRLPCLCIYHKPCIDQWFQVNRSCPEHPAD